MIIMNKECKINYNKKFYKNIPSKTLDLLQKMMNPEEFFRPTAEQALEHSYITGIEDISCSINNSTYSCDLKAEENFCSEQEIKTLEMNMLSLNLMGKEVHMMGEIKNSQFKIDEINTSLIKDKELEHKFMINLIEEDSKSNNYLPNYNRKLKGSYSIIIRTPVITGHIGSINSPECKDKKDKDKDDFSPVMKKELNLNQNKGKNLNFTLMACGFDKNN